MNRLHNAEIIANYIGDYLLEAGWMVDGHTFFQIDPITQTTHNLMTAFQIQFERDLQSQKALKSSVLLIKSQLFITQK